MSNKRKKHASPLHVWEVVIERRDKRGAAEQATRRCRVPGAPHGQYLPSRDRYLRSR